MKVLVLAGGRSSEHEISLASARSVLDGLERAGHEVESVVIDSSGIWRSADPRLTDGNPGRPVALIPGGGESALLKIEEQQLETTIDVCFPVLHGPFGEDGTVQGLLECVDLPYVGADVEASAVCIDKCLFKLVMANAGVAQPSYVAVTDRQFADDREAVERALSSLGLPVFVKPSKLGSSVGISKVSDQPSLEGALEDAFTHCPTVVVESAVSGKEVECSVVGNSEPEASLPGEIRFESEWYDYKAKYEEGGMDLVVPADIPSHCADRVQDLAQEVFRITGCSGLARIDFFVTNSEEILVSELNSMPGFTETSVFSRLFEASGLGYEELLEQLLKLAVDRHHEKQSYSY